MRDWRKVLFLLYFMVFFSPMLQAEVTIEARVNTNEIYMDETILYSVVVSTSGVSVGEPLLPVFKGFTSKSKGMSRNISVLNGSFNSEHIYRYRLKPEAPGQYHFPPATVISGGQRYRSEEIDVTIHLGSNPNPTAATSSSIPTTAATSYQNSEDIRNVAFVEMLSDKTECYVKEQLIVKFHFYYRVPLLDNPEFQPPNLEGFWKEYIQPNKHLKRMRHGYEYNVLEIRMALFPIRSGNLEIGSASLVCAVSDISQRQRRRLDLDDFFDNLRNFYQGQKLKLTTKPLAIKVKPLPTENQPEDFSGAVGAYKIKSTLDRITIPVGEAANLNIEVGGRGWIKGLALPQLNDIEDLTTYLSEPEFSQIQKLDNRVFSRNKYEIALIPQKEGLYELPPLRFVYFHPEKEKYLIVKSSPLFLKATPVSQDSRKEIVDFSSQTSKTIKEKVVYEQKLRYLKEHLGTNQHHSPWLNSRNWLYFGIFWPLLWFLCSLWMRFRGKGEEGREKYKNAYKDAKKICRTSQLYLKKSEYQLFYTTLSQALSSYIGARFYLSPQGLNLQQVRNILKNKGVPSEILENLVLLWERLEGARFGSEVENVDAGHDLEKVKKILKTLEKVLGL